MGKLTRAWPFGGDGGEQDALPDEPVAAAGSELPTAEGSLAGAHAEAISQALYPGGVLQERVHGAAYYFAKYGSSCRRDQCAGGECLSGHTVMWL